MSDVRVLIADDQPLLRASFRLLIEHTPGLAAVGEAGTGAEAVAVARREQPDVVLMDVRMPEMDGVEATRRICGAPETPHTRVLILTTFDLDEYVFGALHAGASGFLLKDVLPDDLVKAVRLVAAGEALLAPTVTRRLIAAFADRPAQNLDAGASAGTASAGPAPRVAARMERITEREQDVLTLVGRGLSNSEIAEELHLSLGTVKTYISRLLAKLAARDRAQLVIAAYEGGLVGCR
jgi:DNA-binding NarL/FixJ family response regulator